MIGFRLSVPNYTLDFRAPLGADFDLAPEEAIAYFQAKGLKPTFSWLDMIGEEHDVAFTVAKMADLDMLADVRAAVDEAISTGKGIAWFREELEPMLRAKGWWGAKEVVDPLTGETVLAQLGSPRRLETIFRTNMQAAYSAGQWDEIADQADVAPWLLYDAIDDNRTRPEHAQWDDVLLPVSDPFWTSHVPPNGWNCRCGIIQLSDDEVREYGLEPSRRPDDGTYSWRNPRTGKKYRIPNGLDPGWDNNPGLGRPEAVAKLLAEKARTYPAALAAAADSAALKSAQEASKAQVLAANQEVAKEIGARELAAGKQTAIQRGAALAIEDAKANKTPYLANAIEKVEQTAAAATMTPKEILDAAIEKAAKQKQAAGLQSYKKSILAGKKPGAAAQAAYNDLPDDLKTKIDSDIALAIAEAQAAQAAALANLEAQATLKGILENPKGQTLKLKALEAKLAGKTLDDIDDYSALLAEVEAEAAALQAKASLAAKLSGYKKKVLLGETPTPAQVKAFASLDGEEMSKFTAKVKAELDIVEEFKAKYSAIYKKAPSKKELEGFIKSKKASKAQILNAMQAAIDDAEKAAKAAQAAQAPKPEPSIPPKAPDAPDAPQAPPQPPPAKPKAPNWDDLEQTGAQQGSNTGGFYTDTTTGDRYYVKFPDSEDIARNEVLAAKLYDAVGVDVPNLYLIKGPGGRVGIASEIVEGVEINRSALTSGKVRAGVGDGFGADAWLANWDVAGLGFDNLLVKGGRAFRIDVGGSLRFRAQGGPKGAAWNAKVSELESLLDSSKNPNTAAVFANATQAEIEAGVARILALSDDDLRRLVDDFGPLDPAVRADLFDTLQARRRVLAAKYPNASKPAKLDKPTGTTQEVADQVRNSRNNGYAIRSDKGEIEDQQILFWNETVDGKPVTNARFKVRGDGERKLRDLLSGDSTAPGAFRTADLDSSGLTAIKGIGYNAKQGNLVRSLDIDRARKMRTEFDTHRAQIEDGIASGKYTKADLDKFDQAYRPWVEAVEEAVSGGEGSAYKWTPPTGKWGPIKITEIVPDAPKPQRLELAHTSGHTELKEISRGHTVDTGRGNYSTEFFEGEIDGTRIRYWGNDAPFALRGTVEIRTPGASAQAIDDILEIVDRELGIGSAVPTALDAEELYLTQIAYAGGRGPWRKVQSALNVDNQTERVALLREILSDEIGTDITKLANYNPTGQHIGFGHGRIVRFRPDVEAPINAPAWRKFTSNYRLHHSNTNSGGMSDIIDRILNSGGSMAATTDKLRRGIPMSGMSPTADLQSGGASYFFTRIKTARSARGEPGFVWRSRQIARTDAISYDHDAYGRVTDDYVETNRQTTIDDWKSAGRRGSNETIFKDGLSLFDDLENIVASSASDRREIIEVFRRHGYTTWPDGRPLEDVIIERSY